MKWSLQHAHQIAGDQIHDYGRPSGHHDTPGWSPSLRSPARRGLVFRRSALRLLPPVAPTPVSSAWPPPSRRTLCALGPSDGRLRPAETAGPALAPSTAHCAEWARRSGEARPRPGSGPGLTAAPLSPPALGPARSDAASGCRDPGPAPQWSRGPRRQPFAHGPRSIWAGRAAAHVRVVGKAGDDGRAGKPALWCRRLCCAA